MLIRVHVATLSLYVPVLMYDVYTYGWGSGLALNSDGVSYLLRYSIFIPHSNSHDIVSFIERVLTNSDLIPNCK